MKQLTFKFLVFSLYSQRAEKDKTDKETNSNLYLNFGFKDLPLFQ